MVEERDKRGRNRYHHAGRNVHQIDVLAVDLDELVAHTAGDTVVDQVAVFVDRLGRLTDDVFVLDVRGHILHLVGHAAGCLVNDAVRRFDEAEVVDARIGRKVGDQADVRTFRGLDRAQAAIVRVVYVAHFKRCAVTRQAAGAERGHTALVRQLCQRVVLVHELGQRRRTEELLDRRSDRADVDQALRGDDVQILNGHALADDALHAGEADAELVLEQLAHAAQAAVAQMVNVVHRADAVAEAEQVADRGEHVVDDDGLGDQVVDAGLDGLFHILARNAGVNDLLEDREVHLFLDAQLLGGKAGVALEVVDVDHAVAEHLDCGALVRLDHDVVDAACRQQARLIAGQDLVRLREHLAGHRADRRLEQLVAGDAAGNVQLLVVLVAADRGNIVAAHVEEHRVHQVGRGLDRGRLARTHLLVDLDEGLVRGVGRVLIQRCDDQRVLAEQLLDLCIGLDADRTDKARDRDLAVLIDADIEHVVGVGLVLEPRAAVRDDRRGEQHFVRLVIFAAEVNAGRTDELGDDRALRAVDDEGRGVGHLREIAHEDLLLLDLTRFLVSQAHTDLEGGCICGVARLALLNAVLGLLVHRVIEEGKLQVSSVVRDGRGVGKNLAQSLVEEPLIGLFLHLDEIGHLQNLIDACKALSCGFAVLYVFHLHLL